MGVDVGGLWGTPPPMGPGEAVEEEEDIEEKDDEVTVELETVVEEKREVVVLNAVVVELGKEAVLFVKPLDKVLNMVMLEVAVRPVSGCSYIRFHEE